MYYIKKEEERKKES